jgi:hypothetical protein
MAGSIRKVQSLVNFPKNRYDNQIYFHVGKEDAQLDMKASYVELELSLPGLPLDASGNPNYRNVVLGQDGMYYNASALFRDAKLTESSSGKYIADNLYVNILSQNLEYYSKGANNVVADALFDGKGHIGSNNSIVSVFNNAYPDSPDAVVRCPLSLLYPGSVGQAEIFPQESDLTFRYLLEPQFKCFMRAVKSNLYASIHSLMPVDPNGLPTGRAACSDVALNTAVITPTATGVVGTFAVGNRIAVAGIIGATGSISRQRTITAITADNGQTPGTITVDTGFSTTVALTNVWIAKLVPYDPNNSMNAMDLRLSGNGLTMVTPIDVNVDVYENTTLTVKYTEVGSTGLQTVKTINAVVSALTLSVPGDKITAITLKDQITVPSNGFVTNISIQPIYTNLTYDWSLNNAHLILYRRKVPMTHQAKMLVSNFSSVNVGMVGGLNRFQYTIKAPNNTYNCYVFTPGETNLFSTADNLKDYLISVNDTPLTSIYVDSAGSAVHKDNLLRVFGNSPYYPPKSLVSSRDKEIVQGLEPTMFVGKIFHSLKKGDPQVLPFDLPDRNIKIELVAADGLSTPTKNVYIFLEKWEEK